MKIALVSGLILFLALISPCIAGMSDYEPPIIAGFHATPTSGNSRISVVEVVKK